ncbi:TRAP transporter small permease [Marinobacterium sp. YM272]|uniref:TRAP transporter small permease n=1 Tax=Marinobacterium sp. YM272 TaxID=3421654 RepID=UPI003D7F5AC1
MNASTSKLFRAIEQTYETFGAIFLLSISGLMFVDVIGRYFLNSPVKGAFDIIEALMALCAFWFLPLLSRDGEHISVTIFRASGGVLARIQRALIELICCAISLLIAWSLYSIASEYAAYNEASLIIGLPKAPFVYICAVTGVLMALTHLSRFLRAVTVSEAAK